MATIKDVAKEAGGSKVQFLRLLTINVVKPKTKF